MALTSCSLVPRDRWCPTSAEAVNGTWRVVTVTGYEGGRSLVTSPAPPGNVSGFFGGAEGSELEVRKSVRFDAHTFSLRSD